MRKQAVAATAGACGLAAVAMLVLAIRQAPSHDEFFTVGQIRHSQLGAVFRSYRRSGDTAPPAYYLLVWAIGRLIGTGIVAIRLPSIVGWIASGASIGILVRRLHPTAIFIAVLVPSISGLAFLGMSARGYGPMLGCFGVALVAWQYTLENPPSWYGPAVVAVALALATALQPVAAAAAAAIAIGEFAALRRHRDRPKRLLVAVLAGLTPILASASMLLHDSQRLATSERSSVRLLSLPAFYVSTARPAVLVIAAVAGVAITGVLRSGRHPSSTRTWLLSADETTVALALTLATPAVVVVAMWLTSGFYLHQYASPALFGGAMLAAGTVNWLRLRAPRASYLIAAAALASVPISAWRASLVTPTNREIKSQMVDLALPTSGPRVVFLEPYEYLLAREAAGPQAAREWYVEGPDPDPGTATRQVDLRALLQTAGRPLEIVGTPLDMSHTNATRWTVTSLASTSLNYDTVHEEITRYHLVRRRA